MQLSTIARFENVRLPVSGRPLVGFTHFNLCVVSAGVF
jgi:hypothetical protein